jgi:hypothetical protein
MYNIKPMINSGFDIRSWRFVVFAMLFLSILRGIRFPSIWSYSHFLFNYDFGIIKRGLIGEIISQFNNPYLISYKFLCVFSIAIFSINIILLSVLIKDFINSQSLILIGCSAVFASSLAVVFLSHSIGYFDHVGLLVALTTLKISGFYKKMLFLLLFMPFALLIHEAIFIMFFPVIFMSLLLSIETEGRIKKILILGAFSVMLLILLVVIANQTLEKSEAHEMYARLQAKIEYPLRQDAFDVLTRDTKDNFLIMERIWSKQYFAELTLSFLVTAPAFLVFIYFTIFFLRKAKVKFYLIMLSILASLSPLPLHFGGLDMHRWNTLTGTVSFLMLYVVYAINKNQQPITTSNYIYSILVFVIFLNGISSIPLFDNYYVKQFPFVEHQQYIIDLIHGKAIFPYVPPR